MDFSWRMDIYDENETRSPVFDVFLRSTAREYLPGVSGYDIWTTIANGAFHSGVSQETYIQSSIYQLLRRLVTFSINHKKHADKVTSLNLFFL